MSSKELFCKGRRSKLQIAFKGYSEREIKDILAAFKVARYQVNRFYEVSLIEVSPPGVMLRIVVLGTILTFLKGFAEETGKILAQRLFSSRKKNKDIDSLCLIIEDSKGEKKLTITAKDYQELHLKIKKLSEQSEER